MLLEKSAVHPNLVENYDKLRDIVESRPGLLGGYSVLHVYLLKQLEVLKTRDLMFGNDFGGDPKQLIKFSIGESRELAEVLPLFNASAPEQVNGVASDEGGDVAWFLAMRIGLAYLDPENSAMTDSETNLVIGMMSIFDGLAKIYPDFNPSIHADKVAHKVVQNYPDRVLRTRPNMTIPEMANEFTYFRLPMLKKFRDQLPNRKIPAVVYQGLQSARKTMPKVEFASPHAPVHYSKLVEHAVQAGQYYAY